MASFDFDAARAERQRKLKPLTFTLGGKRFRCRSTLGLGDLISGGPEPPEHITAGATTDNARAFLSLARVIASYLDRRDLDAWWSLWDPDSNDPVNGSDLLAVSNWLTQEYGLPKGSPSRASSRGPATNGSRTSLRRGVKGSAR